MEEEKYYQKYLKYKQKYLDLQKLKGGEVPVPVPDICNTSFNKLLESGIIYPSNISVKVSRPIDYPEKRQEITYPGLELKEDKRNNSCNEQIDIYIFLSSLMKSLLYNDKRDEIEKKTAFYVDKINSYFHLNSSKDKIESELEKGYCEYIKALKTNEEKKWFFNKTYFGEFNFVLTNIQNNNNCFDKKNTCKSHIFTLVFIIIDHVIDYLRKNKIEFNISRLSRLLGYEPAIGLLGLLCPNDIYKVMSKKAWDYTISNIARLFFIEYNEKINTKYLIPRSLA